jgi:hypothetical protein
LNLEGQFDDTPDTTGLAVGNVFPQGLTALQTTSTDSFIAGSSDLTGLTGQAAIQIVVPQASGTSKLAFYGSGTSLLDLYPGNSPSVNTGYIDNCQIGLRSSASAQFTALTAILQISAQSGITSAAQIIITAGGLSVTGGTTTDTLTSGTVTLNAGTTTTQPLKLTSGTNLTTPVAGSVEYDGKLLYFSPATTIRAMTPSVYAYRNNAAVTLASSTANQSIFGLTSGVTVQASTIYEVEGLFYLTTTGTTSHNESFGFVLTTATVSNMTIVAERKTTSVGASAVSVAVLTAVTPVTLQSAITTAQNAVYSFKGTIAFTTGGSINPVVAFSAAPGGTSTIAGGGWCKFTPVGTTGSNVSIGTWA